MSDLRTLVRRVTVHDDHIDVLCIPPPLENWSRDIPAPDRWVMEDGLLTVRSPLKLRVAGGRTLAIGPAAWPVKSRKDRALIGALRRAHAELLAHGIDASARAPDLHTARGINDPYLRKLVPLAFMAPDIQQAIIAGQQPAGLTLAGILSAELPLEWSDQRRVLDFE